MASATYRTVGKERSSLAATGIDLRWNNLIGSSNDSAGTSCGLVKDFKKFGMGLKDDWNKKDWIGPLVGMVHTAYLLLLDAVKISVLFGLARGVESLLHFFDVKTIKISTLEIGASDIIHNFDYMLLVMFLLALIWRVGENLRD